MPKYYTILPFHAVRENIALATEIMDLARICPFDGGERLSLEGMATDLIKGLNREVPEPEPEKPCQVLPMDSETLLDALRETPSNTIHGIAKYACRTIKEVRKALDLGLLNGYVTKTGRARATKYFASEK